MTDRGGRTVAEWFTFGTSCAVLAAVLALIAVQWSDSDDPALPVATLDGEVRSVDGRFYVDVMVTNEGDDAAASVQINATLAVGDSTTEGDQTIDFLAADEEVRLTFVFDQDPAAGELTVAVTGFADP
jgi:uncharacterized protein (TIGR02588 family)